MDDTTPTSTTDNFVTIIVVINGTQTSIIISDPGNFKVYSDHPTHI